MLNVEGWNFLKEKWGRSSLRWWRLRDRLTTVNCVSILSNCDTQTFQLLQVQTSLLSLEYRNWQLSFKETSPNNPKKYAMPLRLASCLDTCWSCLLSKSDRNMRYHPDVELHCIRQRARSFVYAYPNPGFELCRNGNPYDVQVVL